MQQLKNNIKKLPVIRQWFQRRYLKQELELTQKQLILAVQSIESISRYNLASCSLAPPSALITSLTSYGTRVQTVHHTILSLLCQSVRPKKIILWLAEDEFTLAVLPKALLDLQQYGLEIAFCKDIRSYKKLIPTLIANPNESIVTFDDDVIYPTEQLEKLLIASKQFPNAIICNHARKIVINKNGIVAPYREWKFIEQHDKTLHDKAQHGILPVGIGGVLYPENSLHKDVHKAELFMSLSPKADDLWFKAMAIKNNTKTVVVDDPQPYKDYLLIPNSQKNSLWQENKTNNDLQLAAILNYYPEVKVKLENKSDKI